MKNLILFSSLMMLLGCMKLSDGTCAEDCHTIQGTIIDIHSKEKIKGAEVELWGEFGSWAFSFPRVIGETKTDNFGFFQITFPDSVITSDIRTKLIFGSPADGSGTYSENRFEHIYFDSTEIGTIHDFGTREIYNFTSATLIMESDDESKGSVQFHVEILAENAQLGENEKIAQEGFGTVNFNGDSVKKLVKLFSDELNTVTLKYNENGEQKSITKDVYMKKGVKKEIKFTL